MKRFAWIWIGWLAASGAVSAEPSPTPPPEMVLIPSGIYEMGSRKSLRELDPTALFRSDRHMLGPEDPAHEVFTDAFFMDRTEVTHGEYLEYVKTTGARPPRFHEDPDFNRPDQPVVGVSWKEAQAYCQWRHKRLPTEAEWEKSGRGQKPVRYPWGDEPPDRKRLNFDNQNGKTLPVGSFEAGKSAYGVMDLAGNVAEWVYDWHYPEYYLFAPKENPQGPEKGQYKVIRGGNWRNNADDVRLTYRNATVPSQRNNTVGFRCARDLTDDSEKPKG